jgi:hypothetical protein
MKKINSLFAKIEKVKKQAEEIREKEFTLVDKLHAAVLEEILKGDLFRKMKWRIPEAKWDSPLIEHINATKDDNWKAIEKLLDKAGNISWATTVVSLTDTVGLDIEGGVITLLPRQRETNAQRGIKNPLNVKEYVDVMNAGLLAFVKEYGLVLDFSEVERQRERSLDDLKKIEQTISFCKELNKEKV